MTPFRSELPFTKLQVSQSFVFLLAVVVSVLSELMSVLFPPTLPEISVTGGSLYGLGVDIWSLGAILFECLAGKYMMQVRTLDEANAWKANFSRLSFPADIPLSPQCCDFVSRLVRKVGDGRLSHSQLLSHPWLLPALCLFAISNPTSPDEPPLITCDNKELCVMNESCGALTWKAFLVSSFPPTGFSLSLSLSISRPDVFLFIRRSTTSSRRWTYN